MALIPPLHWHPIWKPWPGLDKASFIMHICSAMMDMGAGTKAQGPKAAPGPPGPGPAAFGPWSFSLGPISIMAEHMCMMNDALSRLGQGFHIGYECDGGTRAMSKHHPSHCPYRIRMQWWDEGNAQAPSQPRSVSDMGDDGIRRH